MLVGGLFGYIVYFLFLLPDVYPNDSNGTFKPNVCFRIEIALREHPVHVSNSSWVVFLMIDVQLDQLVNVFSSSHMYKYGECCVPMWDWFAHVSECLNQVKTKG